MPFQTQLSASLFFSCPFFLFRFSFPFLPSLFSPCPFFFSSLTSSFVYLHNFYSLCSCEQSTGECICKDNVTGVKCDRCIADHWDLDSGTGCKPCACDKQGAVNSTCDLESGECNCKPGVAAPKCEKCAQGFWNFTSAGCQPCKCIVSHAKGMSCDRETGQCSCLPGVIGENCSG